MIDPADFFTAAERLRMLGIKLPCPMCFKPFPVRELHWHTKQCSVERSKAAHPANKRCCGNKCEGCATHGS